MWNVPKSYLPIEEEKKKTLHEKVEEACNKASRRPKCVRHDCEMVMQARDSHSISLHCPQCELELCVPLSEKEQ